MVIHSLIQVKETSSTNDKVRDYGLNTILIADSQSTGRGRQGHVWHSPIGNLYFSYKFALAPGHPEEELALSQVAGVALHRVLQKYSKVPLKIKLPNDILNYEGKKLAGILIERNINERYYVLGIGMNLVSGGLENVNGCVLETDQTPSRVELAIEIVEEFLKELNNS